MSYKSVDFSVLIKFVHVEFRCHRSSFKIENMLVMTYVHVDIMYKNYNSGNRNEKI